MTDLTVILLTANKVPEHWKKYHLEVLHKATDGFNKISMSKEKVDFGENNHSVSSEGIENIYKKVLVGSQMAKTEYVAIAEDDTLYPREHFEYRPKTIAYDMNRWAMLTWGKPTYFHKPMMTNAALIGKRDLIIKALEKPHLHEIGTVKGDPKPEKYYAKYPFLCLSHIHGIDPGEKNKRKKIWPVQAYDIPAWRNVKKIRRIWDG